MITTETFNMSVKSMRNSLDHFKCAQKVMITSVTPVHGPDNQK